MADTNAETSPAKAKVAVFVSGTGTNMAALLYASRLPSAVYEIVLVAANDADAGGLQIAATEGVATFALSHKGMSRADHDAAMEKAALEAGAQYIALAGYMRILSPGFVQRWEGRMLNIHPSLLPKYTGLDTHARAIEAGDAHGGVSVHLVTEDLDAGEILGQIAVAITPGDTPDTLAARVRLAEHQLYPRVLGDYVSRGSDPQHLLERLPCHKRMSVRATALPASASEARNRASISPIFPIGITARRTSRCWSNAAGWTNWSTWSKPSPRPITSRPITARAAGSGSSSTAPVSTGKRSTNGYSAVGGRSPPRA